MSEDNYKQLLAFLESKIQEAKGFQDISDNDNNFFFYRGIGVGLKVVSNWVAEDE